MAVEVLRSCHKSQWRFYSGMPGVLTRGRFYFVPTGTPALPYFHDFYSATWTNDDIQDPMRTGPLQDDARPWTNGRLGISQPPRVPVGQQHFFEGDLRYPTNVNLADLREGIPVTCWTDVGAPFEEFDIVADLQNCCLRNAYAQIVNLLYEDRTDIITTFFFEWLGPSVNLFFYPLEALNPAMLIVVSAAYTLVFCAGTDNREQLVWQAAYGLLPPTNFGSVATTQIWFNLSTLMADRLNAVGSDSAKPVFLAGHSYGGAGVSVLVVRMRVAFPNRDIRLLTWGAPKFTDIAGMDHIASVEFVFVIDTGDIVPQAPLSAEQIGWFGILIPANVRTAWAAWASAPSYLIQSPDGTKVVGPLPSAGADVLLPFVIAWLGFDFIDPLAPHYITAYIARGCLMCNCPTWPMTEEIWRIIFPDGCPPRLANVGLLIGANVPELGCTCCAGKFTHLDFTVIVDAPDYPDVDGQTLFMQQNMDAEPPFCSWANAQFIGGRLWYFGVISYRDGGLVKQEMFLLMTGGTPSYDAIIYEMPSFNCTTLDFDESMEVFADGVPTGTFIRLRTTGGVPVELFKVGLLIGAKLLEEPPPIEAIAVGLLVGAKVPTIGPVETINVGFSIGVQVTADVRRAALAIGAVVLDP